MLDYDYLNFTVIPKIDEVLMMAAGYKKLVNRMKLLCHIPLCLDIFCIEPDEYEIQTIDWGKIYYHKVIGVQDIILKIYVNVDFRSDDLLCIERE